jgi:hypothetical protein
LILKKRRRRRPFVVVVVVVVEKEGDGGLTKVLHLDARFELPHRRGSRAVSHRRNQIT